MSTQCGNAHSGPHRSNPSKQYGKVKKCDQTPQPDGPRNLATHSKAHRCR
jgi:hypothetical protein